MSYISGGYFHQSCHVTKARIQPQLTSTPTNLPSSSSRRLKECVLSPAMCRRRMFTMMHLRNFCQVSIDEVRQVMTRSPVKSSALDRNSEGSGLKIGEWRQLELRTPCEKYLATPLLYLAVHHWHNHATHRASTTGSPTPRRVRFSEQICNDVFAVFLYRAKNATVRQTVEVGGSN